MREPLERVPAVSGPSETSLQPATAQIEMEELPKTQRSSLPIARDMTMKNV